jgi:hypothetical protein
MKKITVYQLSDGRTVETFEAAKKEEARITLLASMKPVLDKFTHGSTPTAIAHAVVGAMINAGWRPPAKQYKKKAK